MSDMNYTGKQYYLAIWKSVLGALLKWPEKQVMNWVGERGLWEFLDNPDDMLYHETPQYWITTLLIPDKLRITLSGLEIAELQGRILDAFKDDKRYKFEINTDWQPYKLRIEEILREYGEGLPVSQ